MTNKIEDPVSRNCQGNREINFDVPDTYNASEILFDNLDRGLGEKIAVYCPKGNATYAELCSHACQIGNALKALGLEKGDRVMLFLDDTSAYPAAFFGSVRAGLVPMLINTQSPKDLIRFYLQDSGAKIAILDAAYDRLFDADTLQGTDVEAIITNNGATQNELSVPAFDGDNWFATFPQACPVEPTDRDDMAFWMYSSGSTGRPKGIVHLHHDMPFIAASFGQHILETTAEDICFSVPKIFFAYGFGNAIVFPFSTGASTVLLPDRPTPAAIFELTERYKPTIFFGLPTLYTAIVNDDRSTDADFSSVRLCLSAAEVLSADVSASWKDRFGQEIIEGLGSTEALHIYLSNRPGDLKLGAAGKRVPGYEIQLKDLEGKPVSPGEEGILWLRGDSNSPCYWNRPDKTADTMRGSWLWTGDRFVEDEDGFFFFRGRADDLIKVSGQWVYPLEIELCLADHPLIRECAVFGVELADRRMTTKAAIVLAGGTKANDRTKNVLQDYVKEKLLPYKYPRIVEFLEDLPKTGTGKIDRLALRSAAESNRQ